MSTALATHVATGGYLFNTVEGRTRYLHVDAAEKALGKSLPKGAEVHHVNGNPADNRNENLVICKDHKYHSLLHRRQEALDMTGNANLRLCKVCGIYDNPVRMAKNGRQVYHQSCVKVQSRKQRAAMKAKQGEVK